MRMPTAHLGEDVEVVVNVGRSSDFAAGRRFGRQTRAVGKDE